MDLIKQYILQCIVTTSDNLRLNSEKIEAVTLIKEYIAKADRLEYEICLMKKNTYLSTFAIKLNEIYKYLTKGKVDFSKISEKYKEHSYSLLKELNTLLDKVTPSVLKKVFDGLKEEMRTIDMSPVEKTDKPETIEEIRNRQEEILLDESRKKEEPTFEAYEEKILKPINEFDAFLKKMAQSEYEASELEKYLNTARINAEYSKKAGFEIIADMHSIFARALYLISLSIVKPEKDVIEPMRACLIVIVALVKNKEVDFTSYLTRAENFGVKIRNIK